MTRDEAKKEALKIIGYPIYSDAIQTLINKIYDDFEQELAECRQDTQIKISQINLENDEKIYPVGNTK